MPTEAPPTWDETVADAAPSWDDTTDAPAAVAAPPDNSRFSTVTPLPSADDNLARAAHDFYATQALQLPQYPDVPQLQQMDSGLWKEFRRSHVGRFLFGPTDAERSLMEKGLLAGPPGGDPGMIPLALTAPNPFTPGPETTAGKLLLGYFVAQYAKDEPGKIAEIQDLFKNGDTDEAWNKVLGNLIETGMTAGAGHGLYEGFGHPLESPHAAIARVLQEHGAPLDQVDLETIARQGGQPIVENAIIPTAGKKVLGPNVPRKMQRPVVPETAPEPERQMSAVEEVRAKGARTVRAIQELFPKAELSREEARTLRNAAFPDDAAKFAEQDAAAPTWEETDETPPSVYEHPHDSNEPQPLSEAEQTGEQAELASLYAKPQGPEQPPPTPVKEGSEIPDWAKPQLPPEPAPKQKPVVPETPAEDRETAVQTVRRNNARTIRQIQELFPKAQMTREQARGLRDAAFPPEAQPEAASAKTANPPPSPEPNPSAKSAPAPNATLTNSGKAPQKPENAETGREVTHSMGGGAARRSAAPAPATPSTAPTSARAPLEPRRVSELVQAVNSIRANVAPQTVGPHARYVGNVLRHLTAKFANEMLRAEHALSEFRADFDRTPLAKDYKYDPAQPLPRNLAFIDAYEGGDLRHLSPREREAAAVFRQQNRDWLDRIHALGTGALQRFIENYFPHMWDNPEKAKQVFAAVLSKRPLEGPKSFLKQRVHQLTREGLAAGLKPVHDNPVDLWLLKKREVERYILAHQFINEMKQAGLLKFVHAFQKSPDGYTKVNDRAFEVYGPPVVKVKEAFDAGMREATLQVLRDLGVPHERLARLGGQRWGYARYQEGVPGTERIVTKFGGPPDVFWHELGHVLDNRYPELRERMHNWALNQTLEKEMHALAALRYEGETPGPSQKRYVHSAPERMAVILQAFVHAPERMAEVAPTVKKEFEIFLDHHPELHRIYDIRPTLRLGTATAEIPVGGLVKMGSYMMPDAAARVVNNYLSPGLNPQLWYRGLREVSNLLNGVQLGLSAFHLGFTSLDAATSRLAIGIEDAMHGDFARAAKTVASVPFSPVTNIMRGAKVRAEVLNPGSQSADIQAIAHALELGGGRVGQEKFWSTEFTRRMTRAFHEARDQDALFEGSDFRTLWNAPFALFEQSLRPIMEYVVPRQKLGVFADMAKRELERLGPGADPADVREAMRKAWDSVDNRMGQIVYDNLFYNRYLRDVALLSFRAYGWQLGKYREGLGAAVDTARAGKAALSGQRPEFTHRMAYTMALPMVVGLLGGMVHWLYTRRMPRGMDYFMPQTGETDANGNPVRLNFPSYVKDVLAYGKHPVTSFAHSLNPMGSLMFDLLQNKDFYDVRIRNPDDPLQQQGSEVAAWAAKQFVPFSVSGVMKLRDDAAPLHKQIMPFFGITPVPTRMTMSPAQELAAELMAERMGDAPLTQEQFDKGKMIKDAVRGIRNDQPEKTKDFAEAIANGKLNPEAVQAMIDRLKYTPFQFQVFHLNSVDDAMRVWRLASPQERQAIQQIMVQKVLKSESATMTDKAKFLGELSS